MNKKDKLLKRFYSLPKDFTTGAQAKVKLPHILGDNMILQQNTAHREYNILYLWPRSKCWIRANRASIQHAATKVTNIDYFLLRIRPFYCKIKSSSKVFLKELFHPSICDSLIGSAYFNWVLN